MDPVHGNSGLRSHSSPVLRHTSPLYFFGLALLAALVAARPPPNTTHDIFDVLFQYFVV